ncbi:MAG: hypothetical protein KA207_15025 [Burkholderiaceae bacterium]|nr:hypothetical protein [Burkholderiaceae bacterium]
MVTFSQCGDSAGVLGLTATAVLLAHAKITALQTTPSLRALPMETRRLRVGQPISPEQFDELTDEQLARLVPRAYREFFPGKDFCADGYFYLHDGNAWSFYKGGFVDD